MSENTKTYGSLNEARLDLARGELSIDQFTKLIEEGAFALEGVKGRANACPISRKEFLLNAPPINLKVGNSVVKGDAREFNPNTNPKSKSFGKQSFGYNLNDKVVIMIKGRPVMFNFSGNLMAIGSGDTPPLSEKDMVEIEATLIARGANHSEGDAE